MKNVQRDLVYHMSELTKQISCIRKAVQFRDACSAEIKHRVHTVFGAHQDVNIRY